MISIGFVFRTRPVVTVVGSATLVDKVDKPFNKIDLYDKNPNTMCDAPDGKKYKW